MALTSTSGLPSAKTLRLASARRRLRAFIDQIAELGTSDFAHLDGKDALTFIKGYSLELREVLERLTPEASEASVNEACAQTRLLVRSEERRVGEECVSTCRLRGSQLH